MPPRPELGEVLLAALTASLAATFGSLLTLVVTAPRLAAERPAELVVVAASMLLAVLPFLAVVSYPLRWLFPDAGGWAWGTFGLIEGLLTGPLSGFRVGFVPAGIAISLVIHVLLGSAVLGAFTWIGVHRRG